MFKKLFPMLVSVSLFLGLVVIPASATTNVPISAIEFTPIEQPFSLPKAILRGQFTVTKPVKNMWVDLTLTSAKGASPSDLIGEVREVFGITISGNSVRIWDTRHVESDDETVLTWHFDDANISAGTTVKIGQIMRGIPESSEYAEISIYLDGVKIYEWRGVQRLANGVATAISEWTILDDVDPLPTGQYVDTVDTWASTYIEKSATERGVFYGTDKDASYFYPNGEMTRALFVQVLAQMAGEPVDTSAKTMYEWREQNAIFDNETTSIKPAIPFNDVTDIATAPYIKWAYDNGIINGTSATTFNPDGSIMRQDMATVLNRYFTHREIVLPVVIVAPSTFTDASGISDYALAHVLSLQKAGVISGYPDGSYQPPRAVSRAETAKVLYVLYESGIIGY